MDIRETVSRLMEDSEGLLRLKPAWVSRVFMPPGKRLGLPDDAYDVGERGYITERWLGSVTEAKNPIETPNEGLSLIYAPGGEEITLRDAVEAAPELIMGADYAKRRKGLGRLAKILDNDGRLPFLAHNAEAGEASYYFPPLAPMGPHPETFFGLHPFIVRERRKDIIARCLDDWERTDRFLALSRAYASVPDDGFHLSSGILHAPGSALTIGLQEDSDSRSIFQGQLGDRLLDKSVLTGDVPPEELEENGMMAFVDRLDWEANGDPYFYENHHTPPVPLDGGKTASSEEWWIFYNTTRYSGTKLIVRPGCAVNCVDRGAYNILAWSGKGTFGGLHIKGRSPGEDEIMVTSGRAMSGVQVTNTGDNDLIIFKFFGPDINDDAPILKRYA
ncbi:MAG: hypothetical protein LBS75_03225 [Synergistaceae bacterium]|jgi:hypothetical protein|nr:hypothetical protein [Synergistaceae bacterium]